MEYEDHTDTHVATGVPPTFGGNIPAPRVAKGTELDLPLVGDTKERLEKELRHIRDDLTKLQRFERLHSLAEMTVLGLVMVTLLVENQLKVAFFQEVSFYVVGALTIAAAISMLVRAIRASRDREVFAKQQLIGYLQALQYELIDIDYLTRNRLARIDIEIAKIAHILEHELFTDQLSQSGANRSIPHARRSERRGSIEIISWPKVLVLVITAILIGAGFANVDLLQSCVHEIKSWF